jgi:hypothetical protein
MSLAEGTIEPISPTTTTGIIGDIVGQQVAAETGVTQAQSQTYGSSSWLSSWLGAKLGNVALITIGVVLAIGALLISQKQTVLQVASAVS